jgi:hypothetical protein
VPPPPSLRGVALSQRENNTMSRKQQLNPLAPAYVPASRALQADERDGAPQAPPQQQEALVVGAALQLAELPDEVCVCVCSVVCSTHCCLCARERGRAVLVCGCWSVLASLAEQRRSGRRVPVGRRRRRLAAARQRRPLVLAPPPPPPPTSRAAEAAAGPSTSAAADDDDDDVSRRRGRGGRCS